MKNIIAAYDRNRVIGLEGALPWHKELPADMHHFKELTTGHTVVMGRLTYESIGQPLPNRRNIVISRDPKLEIFDCEVAHSLEEAFELAGEAEIFIIGGEAIYNIAMPTVDRLFITKIEAKFHGDKQFPEIDLNIWQGVNFEFRQAEGSNKYDYTFIEYERIT